MRRLTLIFLLAFLSANVTTWLAIADTDIGSDGTGVHVRDKNKGGDSGGDGAKGGASQRVKPTAEEKAQQKIRDYKRRLNHYLTQIRSGADCGNGGANTCTAPVDPVPPDFGPGEVNGLPVNAISDEDAAYIAFARLRLTPPSPVIGPSPDLNRWKMAAVGYPLWLSVGGDPTPPAVYDAVADVHVRLEAHVSKVVFSMGDHHAVSCTDVTTAWSKAVAGKKSPACGYTYRKPSLPKGNYTVTATTYWSVAWSTSGGSGVIPFIQSSSTQIPVGELQVLVR